LTRWEPFPELGEVRRRFNRGFDELADRPERVWTPAIDVVREDGRLILRADVPAIRPQAVKVEVEDDILTISGEHQESKEQDDERYVRRERTYGSFSRSLALPAGLDATQITATAKDGVVEVTIPLPEEAKKEKVTITPTVS
jgi:HSP20 family protein